MQTSIILCVIIFTVARGLRADGIEWEIEFAKDTADRIRDHGYPAESHQVETPDNYLIGLYRLPYSHKLQNEKSRRPPVLVLHGITSSSDAWILNGPDDALAFLLVDAGYDVWLGNARGTRYSRANTRLSPQHPYFWRFSWHEIGYYDVASMIDYILKVTGESSLHYVGHSQGTTVFFVLMATRPEYNERICTAHLLAPVAFMSNMKAPLAKYTRRFVGRPNRLTRLLDTMEILPSSKYNAEMQKIFCRQNFVTQFMCDYLNFLVNEEQSVNMNLTVAEHMNETHPAGVSTTQLIHFMQEYESGRFCQLDHGIAKNMKLYDQPTPPDYDVAQITVDMSFYYSDVDYITDPVDIEYLATILPKRPNMHFLQDMSFTHTDFSWAMQVKEVINVPIIEACNSYEERKNFEFSVPK